MGRGRKLSLAAVSWGGMPVPSLHTTKHRVADAQQMGVWEGDLPLEGGRAGRVTELLNKAT